VRLSTARYEKPRSPLLLVRWWRVVLDEEPLIK